MKKMLKKSLSAALAAMFVLSGCSEKGGMEYTPSGGSAGAHSEAREIINALSSIDYSKLSVDLQVDVDLEDALIDMLEDNGVDLYGLESARVDMNIGTDSDAFGVAAKGTVNNVYIASAEVVADTYSGDVYAYCPEVNDVALKVSDMSFDGSEYMSFQREYTELIDTLYRYDYEALAYDYFDTVKNTVGEPDDVYEMQVYAGDLTDNAEVKSYEITNKDACDLLRTLLTKVKNDEVIEQILVASLPEILDVLAEVSDDVEPDMFAGRDLYRDELIPAIDELIEALEYDDAQILDEDAVIEVAVLYDVDKVTGFELNMLEDNEKERLFGVYSVAEGEYFACEVVIPEVCTLVADGKAENGLFTGDFEAIIEGESLINVQVEEVDMDKFMYGIFDGRIIIDDDFLGVYTPEEFEGFKLEVDVANTVLTTEVDLACYYYNEKLASLGVTAVVSDRGMKCQVPATYVDTDNEEEAAVWEENMSVGTIIGNLEEAGISSRFITQLQGAF